MELSYEKLLKELKSGKFRSLYLFHGDESFFIDSLSKYIEEHALTESERSFSQTVVYGKDCSVEQILEAAQQFPMMASRQVIIIKEAQQMRSLDKLVSYINKPFDTTLLVIAHKEKALNKNSKLYKAFAKNGVIVNSKSLYDYQVLKWFPDYLKNEHNIKIGESALRLMVEFLGSDIQKLMNEVKKINIKGDLTEISIKDVQQNIGFGKEFDVFEVQEALAAKDKVKLTRIIRYFDTMMKSQHLIGIISILYKYFSQAYVVGMASAHNKRRETMEELKLSEWYAKKLNAGIKNYGYHLETALGIIKEYELKSKGVDSSNVKPSELLKEMLFKIVNL